MKLNLVMIIKKLKLHTQKILMMKKIKIILESQNYLRKSGGICWKSESTNFLFKFCNLFRTENMNKPILYYQYNQELIFLMVL